MGSGACAHRIMKSGARSVRGSPTGRTPSGSAYRVVRPSVKVTAVKVWINTGSRSLTTAASTIVVVRIVRPWAPPQRWRAVYAPRATARAAAPPRGPPAGGAGRPRRPPPLGVRGGGVGGGGADGPPPPPEGGGRPQ